MVNCHRDASKCALSPNIDDLCRARREMVERSLFEYVRPTPSIPTRLTEAMAYSLLAGGKRLRPLLVMFAGEAVGASPKTMLPAACAVEMVHTYSLIHDDLPSMDDDDWRRGQPTCHKKFGSEALAILAGDGLLTLAFEVLASSYPSELAAVSTLELARGSGPAGMVGGQVLDLIADGKILDGNPPTTLAELEGIHSRKTGALFRACLRIGGGVAGAHSEAIERLDTYGRAFGLAFQITDDLLDVESTREKTGKQVGKDAIRGKLTYPGLLGVEESRRRAHELCEMAVESAEHFGSAGQPLARLARRLLERDH